MKTDADKLRSFLKQASPVIETYGRKSVVSDIDKALATIEESTTVLFCGEFKRGKSSLINSIIGADLCPTDIGVATSVVTTIKYGSVKKAVRYYGNILDDIDSLKSEEIEWDEIQRYTVGDVLEIDNTVLVELSYPCPFLKKGITIIDTPGIGGLDPRHAILTHMALPKADVIVFVTDAGEPMTDSEKSFYLERIVPCVKPCIVLVNKSDLLLADTLNIHINKLKLEFADSTCPAIIPTSARYWNLYNKLDDNEMLLKSNKDAVLAGITSSVNSSRRLYYKQYRDLLIEELIKSQDVINDKVEILNSTSDEMQTELSTLMSKHFALASYRKELENPTSQVRLQINAIFEDARNEVANLISSRGGRINIRRIP